MDVVKIFMALAMVFSHASLARDVVPQKRSSTEEYIRVEKISKTHVKFSHCRRGDESNCQLLGDGNYSLNALRKLRTRLRAHGVAVGVLEIALVPVVVGGLGLAGGVAGGIIAESVFGTTMGGTVGGALWGMIVGGGAGVGISAWVTTTVDNLNPIDRFKRGNMLREAVINDQEVVSRMSISEFAAKLDQTLKYLR